MPSNGNTSTDEILDKTTSLSEMKLKDILKSKVRLDIFFLLSIYGELSLTDLSTLLDKSKPALHRHIKKMINAGLLVESKEEKVRGSIKAKFYRLSIDVREYFSPTDRMALLDTEDPDKRLENIKHIFELEKAKSYISKASIDLITHHIDKLEEHFSLSKKDLDLESFMETSVSPFNIFLLSDESAELLSKQFAEFDQKKVVIDDKFENKHGIPPTKQHLVVMTIIPINKLLEFERKLTSPRVTRFSTLFDQR
ncbi:MAG: helix-turn-helix domain-containing protein [Candidatus Hodarchaeota archaeon]